MPLEKGAFFRETPCISLNREIPPCAAAKILKQDFLADFKRSAHTFLVVVALLKIERKIL